MKTSLYISEKVIICNVTKPITILRGNRSALALDLTREVIGYHNSVCDPDNIDDGHFIIHTDVDIGGNNYIVLFFEVFLCYLHSTVNVKQSVKAFNGRIGGLLLKEANIFP